ncbi:site-specific integrase [Photobacterium aquimaris]|uniref:Site-specific integrase n=1 Tax=Photobacterium aquimaris TaxID=512643 RepID=A0A2T3IMM8_9GAMM|nr:site-specific integrase [Photobacterium aquimaris]OBU14741.1 integrase [Photobacterium aquimaris]PSU29626.1 site-specific integrase [Photobacterium aquimaris]
MLTVTQIKGYKTKGACEYLWDQSKMRGVGRLGVQCLSSGSKVFVFRFFVGNKRNFIQLGSFPAMSLEAARTLAQKYGGMLKQGLNPKEQLDKERKAQEAAEYEAKRLNELEDKLGSLEQLVESYAKRMVLDGKRTSERMLKAVQADVYPVIPPATKAKDVIPNDIKIVLAKMIQRGASTQSNKVRSYLHAAFNYALRHDNDPANMSTDTLFNVTFNPVSSVPKQSHVDKVGEHWLKWHELRQLISQDSAQYFTTEDIHILIQLCVYLGGQRPYEIMASRWDYVDLEGGFFEISSEVSKNYKANVIPLTNTAYSLLYRLKEINGDSGYLFPRNNKLGHLDPNNLSKNIRQFCTKTGFNKFVPRDLRRTVKTLTGELGISKELRDRVQNHAMSDVSSKHYDRYDYIKEKRMVLERWEDKLNEDDMSNIVELFG